MHTALALAALLVASVTAQPPLVWPASALLIALMLNAPRSQWPLFLLLAAAGSAVAAAASSVSALGIGALLIAQTAEAWLAARLLQRRKRQETDLLREWLSDAGAIGLAAPLAGGALFAAILLAGSGEFAAGAAPVFALTHALGNLVFFPLFTLLLSGQYGEWARQRGLRRRAGLAGLLSGVAVSALVALALPDFLPLLIPIVIALIATWRFGMPAASLSVVVLALCVQAMQAARLDWPSLGLLPPSEGSAFLSLYIALSVVCLQPLARYLTQNRRLAFSLMQRELAGSEAEMSLQAKEFAINDSRASYELLAGNMTDVVLKTDREGYVLYASPSVLEATGIRPADLIGKSALELIHPSYGASFMSAHDDVIAKQEDSGWSEYLGTAPDGEEHWFEGRIRYLTEVDDGNGGGAAIVLRSIDERKLLEQQLFAAALTDPLTNLTNRRAFNSMLQYHLDVPVEGCLAIFDIDDFRSINREFGHEVGDKVLTTVAKLLRALLRKDDIISRIGGERFAVLLSRATPDEAEMLCQRVVRTLAEGSGSGPSITVSAGVSRIEGALDDTMKRADAAVVIAKAKGRNRLEMEAKLGRRWTPDHFPQDSDS